MTTGNSLTIRGQTLTPSEQDVVKHLLTRASNQETLTHLDVPSSKNVEFHLGNILRKAGESRGWG